MNLDKLNHWLTLISNIGVLVGILFLASEIEQSNRIAERDGRSTLVSQELDLQRSFIEEPGITNLLVKLSDTDAELTPVEIFQAQTIAQQLVLRVADLTIAYETGFLEGPALERQVRGVLLNIQRIPGIAPFLRDSMNAMRIGEESVNSIIFERLAEELNKHL